MKKINVQKVFCFISFLFILSCCLFYGTRFIKLYLENKKVEIEEKNSLINVIKKNNKDNDNFKMINGVNYFTGKEDKNYLEYSNILWRIIKVNSDNSVSVISDHALTQLAFGKNLNYENSQIFKWLNSSDIEYSGILEKSLNNVDKYLQKTKTCNDIYNDFSNTPCKKTNNLQYLTLLSVPDYLNIGSKDSYLNNSEYFYLSNNDEKNKVWYIANNGNAMLSDGDDIIGVRPVITIKGNVDYISGDGSILAPYKFEKENGLFGSYIKLGDDLWRVYDINEAEVKVMLYDYLKVDNNNKIYQYSQKNSYYDDYSKDSVAYYLNHTFLNSLSYKDKIKEVNWPNGLYNSSNNYDYTTALNKTINSKVALMSIGNVFLNEKMTNYSTMTQVQNKGKSIYAIQNTKKSYSKSISQKMNIVPTISIDKNLLTKGKGTLEEPYEME